MTTPGMSEESMNEDKAREIVKEDRGFGGCDPEGMYEYGKANGFLAGLEQEREKASAILRNREDRIKILEEMVSNEIDKNKSSRQETERLKEQRDNAFRMSESKNPQIDIIRQHNLKLNKELEAERQSTRELIAVGEELKRMAKFYPVPLAAEGQMKIWEEVLARHKAGGKVTTVYGEHYIDLANESMKSYLGVLNQIHTVEKGKLFFATDHEHCVGTHAATCVYCEEFVRILMLLQGMEYRR